MKLFIIISLIILLILFIPIPIKIIVYYSPEDYYVKAYKITIVSKKRPPKRNKPVVKKERKFLSNITKNIDYKSLLTSIFNLNLKIKPILKFKFRLDYSLNDAAKTAVFYGVLCQTPIFIYVGLRFFFNISKFNIEFNPIFEDRFLLKIESSSIIFLSFANIIYITITFLKMLHNQGR